MRLSRCVALSFWFVAVAATSLFAATCDTAGRFTDNGDGTVTDSKTGLTWQRCLEGQTFSGSTCNSSATAKTWSQALALTANGFRVPNIKELQSIVDETTQSPAVSTACFPMTAGATIYVWSSSPYAADLTKAWVIDFKTGLFLTASQTLTTPFVRLVKD
jgi:hypothetical protein